MSVGDCKLILDLHLPLTLMNVQPVFIQDGFWWRTRPREPRNGELDNE